jgi:hypothetical protein
MECLKIPDDLIDKTKSKVYTGPHYHIKNEIQANNSMRVHKGNAAPVGKLDVSEICISISDEKNINS